MHVLVTGATGYIGGRLIPRLLEAGHEVRVLVRAWDSLKGRPWESKVTCLRGDLLEPRSLTGLCDGIDAAFYLVHSMYGGEGFIKRDREAADHFIGAVKQAQSPRMDGLTPKTIHVVYLGGLQPQENETHSKHLRSRAEVGEVLADGLPGQVTEFRAGPIIGSGSASFEMVRYLQERLPVMVTPRWVNTEVQPIAVRDVLAYLELALTSSEATRTPGLGVMDIGSEVLSFKDMMLGVAKQRGHRRWIIPTPVLAPKLAARWVGLVTPIPNALAVPLVEGVTQPLLAQTTKAQARFPSVKPLPYVEAVRLALGKIERGEVETRWSGAPIEADSLTHNNTSATLETVIEDREGLARDQRTLATDVPPGPVFEAVCRIGGQEGWYTFGWAWWLRGLVDAAIGGPGLRRGRRDPNQLFEGEALDWWRVERVEPPAVRPSHDPDQPDDASYTPGLLRLRAEMKLPGRAWLQWEIDRDRGATLLRQTAMFEPKGLPGTLYWYALLPAHHFIFPRLVRQLEAKARERWADAPPVSAQ